MKTPVLLLSLLLLLLVLPPAGHGRHHVRARCHVVRLLPLRVVRPPAVAQQRRLVRAVR